MPFETEADLAVFTSPEEFGDVASYKVAGGASKDIAGIFDAPNIEVLFGEAISNDRKPTFCCAFDDLPPGAASDAGDTLQFSTETLTVVDIKPDGQGMVLLILGQ